MVREKFQTFTGIAIHVSVVLANSTDEEEKSSKYILSL